MYHDGFNYTPPLGWCFIRMTSGEKMENGLYRPVGFKNPDGTDAAASFRMSMVEASAGYFNAGGQLVECTIKPGDRVWPSREMSTYATQPDTFPNDVHVVRIQDINTYARAARKDHEA